MQSQVQVMCRCGEGLNALKDVEIRLLKAALRWLFNKLD